MFGIDLTGTSALLVVGGFGACTWIHGWWLGARHSRTPSASATAAGSDSDDLRAVATALDAIRTQVRDLDLRRAGTDSQLLARVTDVERSARKLSGALRTPRTRGRWGELHLRRAVELAGMIEHCDFTEQRVHIARDEAQVRPDMVVQLAGGRALVIDAKVPMETWLDAIECDDPARRRVLEQQHAACVREHVRTLSNRDYARAVPGAEPVVVLYLPAEDLLRAALEHDPSLLEFAAQRSIALATPISLISILRSASLAWQHSRLADNAEQIAALGGRLYDRIGVVNDHLTKLGRSLEASVRAFDETVGSVRTRLVPAARGLHELDAAAGRPELRAVDAIERYPRVQEMR